MKTSISFWDSLFGKKVTIDFPFAGGKIQKMQVTERWLAEMQRSGMIKPVGGQSVKVHILDPLGEISGLLDLTPDQKREAGLPVTSGIYRTESWVIGRDISAEQYDELKDRKTGELFALIGEKDGERRPRCLTRENWLEMKRTIDKI